MKHLILSLVLIFGYWFLSIVAMSLHELGHVIASLLQGVPVKDAGLAWKGAYIVRESGTPRQNILTSLAGPFTNFLIGFMLWPNYHMMHVWHFFAAMNFVLGAANLLPITGSDGDRIITCWQTIQKEKHVASSAT